MVSSISTRLRNSVTSHFSLAITNTTLETTVVYNIPVKYTVISCVAVEEHCLRGEKCVHWPASGAAWPTKLISRYYGPDEARTE